MQVTSECAVSKAEMGESYIQHAGLFPHPQLWGGVSTVLTHRYDMKGVAECFVPGGLAHLRDKASYGGKREGKLFDVYVAGSVNNVTPPNA